MSYKPYPYIKAETVPHLFANCNTHICLHTLVDYVYKAATFVLSTHLCHFHLRILVNHVFKAAPFTANQPTFRQTISTGFCAIILLQLWCKQFVVYQDMQAEMAGVVVMLWVEWSGICWLWDKVYKGTQAEIVGVGATRTRPHLAKLWFDVICRQNQIDDLNQV